MSPITLEGVRQIFENSPFVAFLGFRFVHFEEGKVILELPIDNRLINVNKTVHGGAYAAMLDNILSMTIRSVVKDPVTTINLNIHYLDSISEGKMIATAKILKQGYKTLIGEGEITDGNGKLLAKGTGTFKVTRK
ncbi:PaaI family thioesterase [Bacillus sp. FJAT-49705]|uniref:PaaI family thioesterase n=1 Tax=Cytobacillus citreus TaxID=2833586 RepID=A0ABS5NX77_9BACI|nr:PaaI family thioesterase [Cytobacillus citreus]MBS4192376.1 PaaI family thioesterase [Cytobacillus citreus]